MARARHTWIHGLAAATIGLALAGAPSSVQAATSDPFYTYTGTKKLSDLKPGTVLKTRTLKYSLSGIKLPINVTQILFRTTNQRGKAIAGVTSVLKPPAGGTATKVISYQSFYDSLNPEDGPSRAIAGGTNFGGYVAHAETLLVAPFLLQGYTVNVPDTEGPMADFAAGPEYGQVTLDSIRALYKTSTAGVAPTAKVGLVGYSGGAIATNWAAVLAPKYAPDVNKKLVGAAEGGVFVRPATNLTYIDGSLVWSGVMPMALIGVSRSFGIDLKPYLSEYGLSVFTAMQKASIVQGLGSKPGLTWKKMTKPQYSDPAKVPIFVTTVNKLNLGKQPSPTIPMFIGQGALGEAEGTSGTKPGIGPGDGVMVAGDVRSLARKYCADGAKVVHREYPLSHVTSVPVWLPEAIGWMNARFAGKPPTNNCSSIKPGNPLPDFKAAR
jgi:hypothetical protein